MNCRVCLKETKKGFNIFDDKLNIAAIIEKHIWFTAAHFHDCTTPKICKDCWDKINDFHQFYLTIENAHHNYRNIVTNLATVEIIDEKNEIDINYDGIELEDKLDINGIEIKEDISITNISETKENNEECDEIEDSNHDTDNASSSNDEEKSDESDDSDDEIEEDTEKVTEKSIKVKEENKLIAKHIALLCHVCSHSGEDYFKVIAHIRSKHSNEKAFVACCGRIFTKRSLLLQHAYFHENPQHFKCNECNKSFCAAKNLQAHQKRMHNIEALNYACNKCPKRFTGQYELKLHKDVHIPLEERKFFCPQCPNNKPFGSKNRLKAHIYLKHVKASNVCHICAKEIRDKKAFEKHVRSHTGNIGPRVKCPRTDCDCWLKDESNLKLHLRRHVLQDEGKTFECEKCTKTCLTIRALRSHQRYAHNDRVYTCEICNKTYKRELSLKEHIASHTGERLYKCPFCERTFNSNANMHSHKKKQHPEEWEHWRRTKQISSQTIITN